MSWVNRVRARVIDWLDRLEMWLEHEERKTQKQWDEVDRERKLRD